MITPDALQTNRSSCVHRAFTIHLRSRLRPPFKGESRTFSGTLILIYKNKRQNINREKKTLSVYITPASLHFRAVSSQLEHLPSRTQTVRILNWYTNKKAHQTHGLMKFCKF